MAKLYGNENFPQPVVQALRDLGHDVLTVAETGRAAQAWEDESLLKFATGKGRAVLTLNRRHFVRLHQRSPDHAGIVVCTFDPDFVVQARRIDAAVRAAVPSLAGQLIRGNRPA